MIFSVTQSGPDWVVIDENGTEYGRYATSSQAQSQLNLLQYSKQNMPSLNQQPQGLTGVAQALGGNSGAKEKAWQDFLRARGKTQQGLGAVASAVSGSTPTVDPGLRKEFESEWDAQQRNIGLTSPAAMAASGSQGQTLTGAIAGNPQVQGGYARNLGLSYAEMMRRRKEGF